MHLFRWCLDAPLVLCEHHAAPGGGFTYPIDAPSGSRLPMSASRYETLHLGSLDRIVDRVHELFDQWHVQRTFPDSVSRDMLARARLVIHEWIANLVQHADFGTLVPEIALSLWIEADGLHCVVMDNSSGFEPDLEPAMTLEEVCQALPERGMGLLMLHACTTRLDYSRVDEPVNRLEFLVAPV